MDLSDKAVEVRQGEELDTKKVGEFLKDSIPGLKGDMVVEQFPSGFSNLTYLIRIGEKELVLRRPPFGRKAKSAHDMGREYKILNALAGAFPYCPKPLLYTEDAEVMGCPFYVMERIKGIILRRELPKGIVSTKEQGRMLCERLMDVLYELHSVDYKKVGLKGFGKPEGYVRRQVEGWIDRYRQARTPDAPDFENVMEWLLGNMPDESGRHSIIHNDYKFDNVVLSPKNPLKIIGVLDWEMATIGDPLMDLGCSLAYWAHPTDPDRIKLMSVMPIEMPGLFTREQLIQRYAERAGIKIDNVDYYCGFGFFRLAVIIQQIYYRSFHGQTKDQRFKGLVFAVQIIYDELTAHLKSGF